MNYIIRKLRQEEVKILDKFLYEAIFIPEGVEAPPMEIINQPELQVYIDVAPLSAWLTTNLVACHRINRYTVTKE